MLTFAQVRKVSGSLLYFNSCLGTYLLSSIHALGSVEDGQYVWMQWGGRVGNVV